MRWLEVIMIMISLTSAGVIIFGKRKQSLDAALLSALVIVVLLHGMMDHFRLQMVPAYVVTLALIIVLILRQILLPVFSMPNASGKYAIGTISQSLTDATREET